MTVAQHAVGQKINEQLPRDVIGQVFIRPLVIGVMTEEVEELVRCLTGVEQNLVGYVRERILPVAHFVPVVRDVSVSTSENLAGPKAAA